MHLLLAICRSEALRDREDLLELVSLVSTADQKMEK